MFQTVRSLFVGASAVLIGMTASVTAFAALDAPAAPPVVAQPRPVKLFVREKAKTKKTTIRIKRAKPAIASGLKGVVIDEPNIQEGTISVVTEKNEFATIAIGQGTRIARGYQIAGLNNVHTGYTVRCVGAWDRDGFQYQATNVALGNTVRDTDVIARINAACENIGKARKGGGFGQALVATLPRSLSQGVSIGGRPNPVASPAPAPVPVDLVAPQNPAAGTPAPPTQPVVPINPAQVPTPAPVAAPTVP